MSWRLGRSKLQSTDVELRENSSFAFGPPRGSSPVDRAATPKPSSRESNGQKQTEPKDDLVRLGDASTSSDLLTVSVITARGLSIPSDKVLADKNGHSNSGKSLRERQTHLPYVVLEFDKNEVLILASSGDVSAPQWQFTAYFDISRRTEVSLHVYLRGEAVAPASGPGFSVMGLFGSTDSKRNSASGHGTKPMRELLEGNDVYLGSAKLIPTFESTRSLDTWLPVVGGTGEIHVQLAFKPQQGHSLSIESFELLKVIGKGSFGKVMQVRKRDTNRVYAMKIIRKAHIISRSEVTHTLAERTVLAQVNSPFIVPLKFSFQSPDKLYLGLAFVNGGELFHYLQKEGRFSEERARFYTAELFCALEHLHDFNVIYRDLKPENILLDYTGHIALCDFGLCKLNMGDQETTHTFCGTPEYLAPELLLGQGYTKSVDWWTLGVLLYEMLAGLPPFYSEDVNEMYRKILHDPLTFPPDFQPDARDLLARLLHREAPKRLGYGAHGATDIKNHPFFTKHIDWVQLLAKKVQPPYKPGVRSALDTSNFDPEFTSEPAQDSMVDDSHLISAANQEQFTGFSYNAGAEGMSIGNSWQ
ncbi:non-specific serine/threonine protein kinase [Malassezia psittaci]|uniref:non-specific serine/threonine protein kinase n=1 Tax=Malassezia psittaci TaxID=1821823 RepID=A0AAF0F3N2_9BASI|nr:non-specific serine/threonine protein kinase [Malassezia psittaci]